MDAWSFLLSGVAFLALLMAGAAGFGGGVARSHRTWLAVLLLSTTVFMVEFLLMRGGFYRVPVVFLSYPIFFLMGPAFWMLALALLTGRAPGGRATVPHLVPPLAMLANFVPYYRNVVREGSPALARPEMLVSLDGLEMMGVHLAHTGCYAAAGFALLRQRGRRERDAESGAGVEQVRWVTTIACGFVLLIVAQAGAAAFMGITGRHVVMSEYVMALSMAGVILPLGWTISRGPALLPVPMLPAPKYLKSRIAPERLGELRSRLLGAVERDRLYLDPELCLDALSAQTGLPAHDVSQILNAELRVNFYDFVNRYRAREVCARIVGGEAERKTLLAIALECGFSSKAAFNRCFKQYVGMTPSEFRKRGTPEHPILKR